MRNKNILYITPIMPERSRNGLAMRAASVLQALARRFDVHLFVVPVAGEIVAPSDFVELNTVRVTQLDLAANLDGLFRLIARINDSDERARAQIANQKCYLSRFCTQDSAQVLVDWTSHVSIDAVHVMRLYLAPLAHRFLHLPALERPLCGLDLDDDDIRTYQRFAKLYYQTGNSFAAADSMAEAEKYSQLANSHIPAFDSVFVASGGDKKRFERQFPSTEFRVLPNVYERKPTTISPLRSNPDSLHLLFVGAFGYFPNVDAAMYLCQEILPALRLMTDARICIDLVGPGGLVNLGGVICDPSVRIMDYVADLKPFYATADVAVVPLRVGGGTRIKILEAFAHETPVVSTGAGAEGLDVIHEEHLLIADDVIPFSQACIDLKRRPGLGVNLAARAAKLLAERYSQQQVENAIDQTYLGSRAQ